VLTANLFRLRQPKNSQPRLGGTGARAFFAVHNARPMVRVIDKLIAAPALKAGT
jgi:hypothetical protein